MKYKEHEKCSSQLFLPSMYPGTLFCNSFAENKEEAELFSQLHHLLISFFSVSLPTLLLYCVLVSISQLIVKMLTRERGCFTSMMCYPVAHPCSVEYLAYPFRQYQVPWLSD